MKQVYLFDQKTGSYSGEYLAQESPLDPGKFIEPVCSTDIAPPKTSLGEMVTFNGTSWDVFKPEPVAEIEPLVEELPEGEILVSPISEAKEDAGLLALSAMSPSEARLWVDGNVNSLDDARAVIATLAVAVCALSKQM
jgi:hypothetical protein